MIKSKILFKPLREVFDSGSGDEFYALLAMFSVLYEDLRLELLGISTGHIKPIDDLALGDAYRRLYLVRKAAATQLEFSGAIKRLSGNSFFKALRKRSETLHGKSWKPWDHAVRFFQDSQYHETLKKVRNDVGGHFHFEAAKAAVENFDSDAVGKLEITVSRDRVGYKLLFAGEIAATASLRHLPGAESEERARKLAVDLIKKGSTHATAAMYVLVENFLLERFGFWSRRSRR
jgi:hypothetical protein